MGGAGQQALAVIPGRRRFRFLATYLPVQPAVALVFVFLGGAEEQEVRKEEDPERGAWPGGRGPGAWPRGGGVTLMQTPVVASHSVRMELF